jgi:hypothetical protein
MHCDFKETKEMHCRSCMRQLGSEKRCAVKAASKDVLYGGVTEQKYPSGSSRFGTQTVALEHF